MRLVGYLIRNILSVVQWTTTAISIQFRIVTCRVLRKASLLQSTVVRLTERMMSCSCLLRHRVVWYLEDGNSLFNINIGATSQNTQKPELLYFPLYCATCFGPTTPRRSAIAKQITVYVLKYSEGPAMSLTFSFRPVNEKPGFDTRSVLVVVEKVVLVTVLLRVRLFSPVCIIPPILHPQLHLHVLYSSIINRQSHTMKYKILLFIKNKGEHGSTCFGSWEPSSGL